MLSHVDIYHETNNQVLKPLQSFILCEITAKSIIYVNNDHHDINAIAVLEDHRAKAHQACRKVVFPRIYPPTPSLTISKARL